MRIKIKDWIMGIFATTLALVSMGVFARLAWKGWEELIRWIMVTFGVGSEIEYILGFILFIFACMLGLIQLKRFKKKLKLPFLVLLFACQAGCRRPIATILHPSSSASLSSWMSRKTVT